MNCRNIDTAETAKFIRQALKESFGKAVKFSVTIDRYSMGSSVRVKWTDGPTEKQVEAVIGAFDCKTYNAYEDYHGSKDVLLDGERVSFMGSISTSRNYSTEFLQKQVDRLWDQEERHGMHPKIRGVARPVVVPESKWTGAYIPGPLDYTAERYVYGKINKFSSVIAKASPTAQRVTQMPEKPQAEVIPAYLN